jgi:hypothetical protein
MEVLMEDATPSDPTPTIVDQTDGLIALQELALEHLGMPRPGMKYQTSQLQDDLLPAFMETARYSWLASSSYQRLRKLEDPQDPALLYLVKATELDATRIEQLEQILNAWGVQDMLEDMVASPYSPSLGRISLDPYDSRLLKATGYPSPQDALSRFLQVAAQNTELIADLEQTLEEARKAALKAHKAILGMLGENRPSHKPVLQPPKPPKRRKLFTGLGTLFSGLVLVTGNSLIIPTVPMVGVTALQVVGSIAAGLAASGKGIGDLLNEGEEIRPVPAALEMKNERGRKKNQPPLQTKINI